MVLAGLRFCMDKNQDFHRMCSQRLQKTGSQKRTCNYLGRPRYRSTYSGNTFRMSALRRARICGKNRLRQACTPLQILHRRQLRGLCQPWTYRQESSKPTSQRLQPIQLIKVAYVAGYIDRTAWLQLPRLWIKCTLWKAYGRFKRCHWKKRRSWLHFWF